MKLEPMRFKDYVWPHNPRVYGITYERRIALGKVPFGRYVMQNMGLTCRVLRGEGEFYGPDAYDEFKRLATVFYEESPGTLIHPVWQMTSAYFVGLSLNQEPTEDYVSYTFEFWECYDGYREGAKKVSADSVTKKAAQGDTYYTVVSGDTMWAIAVKYGLSLSGLMALNPQIKNPNLIYPGDRICVAKGGE
ncbi:MAG: SafA/ExsA family spore coat assembly protein [Oscillospiraceae bacterium]